MAPSGSETWLKKIPEAMEVSFDGQIIELHGGTFQQATFDDTEGYPLVMSK